MAAAPTPMPPPPGATQGAPGPTSPQQVGTQPPPDAGGNYQKAQQLLLKLTAGLIEVQKLAPIAAPAISKAMDNLRMANGKIQSMATPSEPSAPPMNG